MSGPPPVGEPAQTCAWSEPPPALKVTVVPAPGLYFGHVPLIVGSFVGVVLLALVTPLLLPEPPLELLVPPEEPPLLELFVPLELLVVPLELLELLVRPELEPLEPLPLCPLDVFKPTPD